MTTRLAFDFLSTLFAGIPGAIELTAIQPANREPIQKFNTWTEFVPNVDDQQILWNSLVVMGSANVGSRMGVYYGVTTRRTELESGASVARGGEASALYAPCLWADVDFKAVVNKTTGEIKRPARTWDEITYQFLQMNTPPSICIATGGGLQGLWLLSEPLNMTDYSTSRIKTSIHKGLQAYVGSDSVANGDRVLRLPGFTNTKHDDPPLVEIVWADWDLRYSLEQFEQYAVELPRAVPRVYRPATDQTMPQWVVDYLKAPPGEGERNATLYRIAATLKDHGWSVEAVLSEVSGFAGLPAYEVERTVRSAFTKAPRGQVARTRQDFYEVLGE